MRETWLGLSLGGFLVLLAACDDGARVVAQSALSGEDAGSEGVDGPVASAAPGDGVTTGDAGGSVAASDAGRTADAGDAGRFDSYVPREDDRPAEWSELIASACRDDRPVCEPGAQCPTFAEVVADARSFERFSARDDCQSESGERFVALAVFGPPAATYIYRRESGELVGALYSDDTPLCEGETTSNRRIVGIVPYDCSWVRESSHYCSDDAAPDVHRLDTCLYSAEL